jgi:hypothetical protein
MNHTHLHKASNTWFTLDACETCGGPLQAVNAVTVHPGDHHKLIARGVIVVDELPVEGWYDEDTEMEVCEACS